MKVQVYSKESMKWVCQSFAVKLSIKCVYLLFNIHVGTLAADGGMVQDSPIESLLRCFYRPKAGTGICD